MSCEGRIFDTAALCAGLLGRDHRRAAQIVRYANLIHILGYVGVSPEYDDNFFELLAADLHLVSKAEMTVLAQIGPSTGGRCYREVVTWAVRAIKACEREGDLTPQESVQMSTCILRLRGCIGTLYDFAFQPIPFVYYNMAYWLLLLYLPLANYALATNVPTRWLSIIMCILANTCFVGLLEIARRFLYPYGTDVEDLAVFHFINFAATASLAMLDSGVTITDDEHRVDYLPSLRTAVQAKEAKQGELTEQIEQEELPREIDQAGQVRNVEQKFFV